jgi:hypothetical protein
MQIILFYTIVLQNPYSTLMSGNMQKYTLGSDPQNIVDKSSKNHGNEQTVDGGTDSKERSLGANNATTYCKNWSMKVFTTAEPLCPTTAVIGTHHLTNTLLYR